MKQTNRRNFLGKFALTTAVTSLGITQIFAKAESNTNKESVFTFKTEPYLQALTPTSVSIMCITSKDATTWVEYGENIPNRKEQSESDGFKEANQTVFNIKLTHLSPGRTYYYKVCSKEITSFKPYELTYGKQIETAVFKFTTPSTSSDKVSCLILNDIHDRPTSFSDLISLNNGIPYDFVFLNGDMFDYQENEKQLIDHLIAPCTELFAKETPFILSRGNHETRGKFARDIKPYFAYPTGDYYFAFKQGSVFFIVLDTGEDKPDDAEVYAGIVNFDDYREKQAGWLNKVMESKAYKEAPHKVVLMHIPPYHSGDWHGTMHCRELFSPLFENHKVDMVISGHTHQYGIHGPDDDHSYPIIIGGGPQDGKRTLIRLDASLNELKVVMTADNNLVVGEYSVKRKRS